MIKYELKKYLNMFSLAMIKLYLENDRLGLCQAHLSSKDC